MTQLDLPQPNAEALLRTQNLTEVLRKEIAIAGGYIAFSQYMKNALYHPQYGYYTSPFLTIGKEGDFTTAPQLSPLYGKCIAAQCIQIFNATKLQQFLEIGAGTGQLAFDLLQEFERQGTLPSTYFILELSPALREKQQALLKLHLPHLFPRIKWLNKLPVNFSGIVFANEVLDALPFDCFSIHQGQVQSRCVSWVNEAFRFEEHEPNDVDLATALQAIKEDYHLPEGYHSEICPSLNKFCADLFSSLANGVVLFADYGYGQAEYYHPERRHGTLSCFYRHQHFSDPFIYPGLVDITAHVDFTATVIAGVKAEMDLLGFTNQSAFLLGNGLTNFAADLEQHLKEDEAFVMHQAIKTLTMPSEMGEVIKFMALGKNISLKLAGFQLLDRRRDL